MAILGSILKTVVDTRGKIPKRTNFYAQQAKVLKKLMTKAQYTAFGEHYHFNRLLSARDSV
ncbi:hypothetical protein, partial [Salmonella enterica]|uniref:hypothetical protein n=1 Tax=Salmonella enterica TaxID=28901 RepID=UPI0020A58A95